MPIFVYACAKCGTQVEKLTRTSSAPIPGSIANACPSCKVVRRFDRIPTSGALRTSSSVSSVKESVRSSQRTSQEKEARRNNIKQGLTGDGRQPTNLKQRSQAAWGGAFSNQNPDLDQARAEIQGRVSGKD